jgi:hypothetical protein
LIGEKNIHFQHDDGTLHFFNTRSTINAGSPYNLAVAGEDLDTEANLVTRLRMEGVDVYEHIDETNLKQYGNLFRLAHSEEINSLGELQAEAERLMDDYNSSINATLLQGAADPRIEPDDQVSVTFTGSDRTDTRTVIVDAVSFDMTIDENNAIFDMEIEARDV